METVDRDNKQQIKLPPTAFFLTVNSQRANDANRYVDVSNDVLAADTVDQGVIKMLVG